MIQQHLNKSQQAARRVRNLIRREPSAENFKEIMDALAESNSAMVEARKELEKFEAEDNALVGLIADSGADNFE